MNRRRKLFRTAALLVGLCLTLWQVPNLVESIEDRFGERFDLFGGLFGATGGAENADSEAGETKKEDLVVFAAQGDDLSPAERERLLAQARALAPEVPEKGKKTKKDKPSAEGDAQKEATPGGEQAPEALQDSDELIDAAKRLLPEAMEGAAER